MGNKKYKKIVIGIDQSYTGTGISICADGKLQKVTSLDFKGLKTKSQKRKHLHDVLTRLLKQTSRRALQTIILCERIRTNSNFGNEKAKQFAIHPSYLIATGALVATIVDTAADFNVPVYSVDTRSWKSKIVGSSKAKIGKDGKRDAKSETVEFVQSLGFDLFVRVKKTGKNKGEPIFDDDAADSACIALYGFIPKADQRLKLEE